MRLDIRAVEDRELLLECEVKETIFAGEWVNSVSIPSALSRGVETGLGRLVVRPGRVKERRTTLAEDDGTWSEAEEMESVMISVGPTT